MSNFAKVDESGMVVDVKFCDNAAPNEGLDWLQENFPGRWVKTSYNNSIRVRFAGIGMFFDEVRDAFYFLKPDDGNPYWFFNEATVQWELPKPSFEQITLDPNWMPTP